MDRAAHHAIFRILRRRNPDPCTELAHRTPFELLISVMLSAQSTDVSVNRATATLFAAANTPQATCDLGLRKLKTHIKSIGLYNTKARNIIETCRILLAEHGGQVPADRAALERLPGVGRKTANVVLNTAFRQPTIAVDTHIFRVGNRTGLAPGRNVREVEEQLLRVVPAPYRLDAHHWLILHGRYVCQARAPRCGVCPIYKYCEWEGKEKALHASVKVGGRPVVPGRIAGPG